MTHGHEVRWGNDGGRGYRAEGNNGKKWDNCNSIINKIYFKKSICNQILKYEKNTCQNNLPNCGTICKAARLDN